MLYCVTRQRMNWKLYKSICVFHNNKFIFRFTNKNIFNHDNFVLSNSCYAVTEQYFDFLTCSAEDMLCIPCFRADLADDYYHDDFDTEEGKDLDFLIYITFFFGEIKKKLKRIIEEKRVKSHISDKTSIQHLAKFFLE